MQAPLYWGVLIVTEHLRKPPTLLPVLFQSSLLRCSYCDKPFCGEPFVGEKPWVSILFTEMFSLWPREYWPRKWSCKSFNPLYWGVSIVTRALNPLISLVPYAIFRTPPRNWHFLGDVALVRKWPKCRFPLCDAGLRFSEHPRGFCRSSRCSENQFLIGRSYFKIRFTHQIMNAIRQKAL